VPTVSYHYLRALELEGRHPSDAGCWPVTVHRLEVGEGLPKFDTSWAGISFPEGEAYPPTNRPPPAVLWRNFYYRRIRSAAECAHHMLLNPNGSVQASFHLTAAWAHPPGGMIPRPSDADPPIPFTHAAQFIAPIPDKCLFHFRIKWSDWGDRGTGYMPYEYFDRYVFECWATYGRAEGLRLYKVKKLDDEGRVRWSAQDEEDHSIYAFEVRDAQGQERRAWTFVIERDGALEVEELYVRPEYRRLGHGRWLADRVAQLARERGLPLRLWVAFADCKAESQSNYPALVATARRLGVQFRPCPVPWAAYLGTTEQPGEVTPVEPVTLPERPRAPRDAVRAFVLALAFGQGESSTPVPPQTPSQPAHEAASGDGQRSISPGPRLIAEKNADCEPLPEPPDPASDRAKVRIVDLGRGPQIEGHRLTVLDIFYYLHRGYDFDFIHEAMPTLTRAQFDAVVEYVNQHQDELAEKDRSVEAFHQRGMEAQRVRAGVFAESQENLTTVQRVARLKEKRERKLAEKNGARHPD
jgi:GNAT superfamily N-acetyltransferase/uncharacterized protein (DUF433 family)